MPITHLGPATRPVRWGDWVAPSHTLPTPAEMGAAGAMHTHIGGDVLDLIDIGGVPVTLYGATGDGATDDTAAINAAIAALNAQPAKGGVLRFPKGTYRVTSALNPHEDGILFVGEGFENTVIVGAIPTLIEFGIDSQIFGMRDLTIRSTMVGDGSIKAVQGTDAQNCRFEDVRVEVMYPLLGSYDDRAIDMDGCYFSAITRGLVTCYAPTDTDPHTLTGEDCLRMSGTGIYSNNNNALYLTDTTIHQAGVGIHLHDDDGVMVSGGACEYFDRGVMMDGVCTLNTVAGTRFESHFEEFVQLLPRASEQCAIYLDSTTYNNDILNPPYHMWDIYPPHNMAVIDKAEKGRNRYPLTTGRGAKGIQPLVGNGDFKRWDGAGTLPNGWAIASGATLSRVTDDLPIEPGISDALKVVMAGNAQGAKSLQFWYDPANGDRITIRAWVKRVDATTGSWRFNLWDVTAAGWLTTTVGPFTSAPNTFNLNLDADEWVEYVIDCNPSGATTARLLKFYFCQDGATAVSALITGVVVLQGRHSVVPPVFTMPQLYGAATYNPASIAAGANTSTTITVAGAALGDYVRVAFDKDCAGVLLHGYVSAAGTVTVYLQNVTGGAVDLAAGNLYATVIPK